MPTIQTPLLDIDHIDDGGGSPVLLLLHGWPDTAGSWDGVRAGLVADGHRVVVPSLRGSGATRFLDDATFRDGTAVALAQDVLDLGDALGIDEFAVVGHDWGARAAYVLAAVAPHRLTSITGLSVGYQPHGTFEMSPSFVQARQYWYQWLMHVDAGADLVRADPIGFARAQWDTWSPAGWYDEADFAAVTQSFANPDWVDITLNAYRVRFRPDEPVDPRYDGLRETVADTGHIGVPTLCVHGGADTCTTPAASEGLGGWFDDYRRVVIDGVGHFPQRENPEAVLAAVREHLAHESR